MEINHEGKKRAKNVQVIRPSARQHKCTGDTPAEWKLASAAAIPLFVALYVAIATRWPVSLWFAAGYAGLSLVAFFAYAFDKSAARAGRWRVSEGTLHSLGLAGGWPGALQAQQLLRHKSNKPSFRSVFWATVSINTAGFVAANSPLLSRLHA